MKNKFSFFQFSFFLFLSINSQNVFSATPSIQSSNIVITNITSTTATISWTNGNGANRLVFVENPSGIAAAPSNNTSYTASSNWNIKGTKIGTSNYYCVYNGSSNSITLTNLTPNSRFAVRISEYNGLAGSEQYLTTIVTDNPKSFTTLASVAITPSTQSSNIDIANITSTSATISWTNGNGANRLVFVENPSGIAAAPSNNTSYTASSNWNIKGTKIGTSNYYCVYNGSSNSITLTNLTPNSRFAVRISEYNGLAGSEQYLTTIVTDNPKSFTTLVSVDIKNTSYNKVSVSVLPNPTSGLITIKSTVEIEKTVNVSISNLQGIVMYEVTTNQNSVDIDLSNFTLGIYFVKVDVGGIVTIHKVIRN